MLEVVPPEIGDELWGQKPLIYLPEVTVADKRDEPAPLPATAPSYHVFGSLLNLLCFTFS